VALERAINWRLRARLRAVDPRFGDQAHGSAADNELMALFLALNTILAAAIALGIVALLTAGIVTGRLPSDSASESVQAPAVDRLAA
jgi:hypothetical protein